MSNHHRIEYKYESPGYANDRSSWFGKLHVPLDLVRLIFAHAELYWPDEAEAMPTQLYGKWLMQEGRATIFEVGIPDQAKLIFDGLGRRIERGRMEAGEATIAMLWSTMLEIRNGISQAADVHPYAAQLGAVRSQMNDEIIRLHELRA